MQPKCVTHQNAQCEVVKDIPKAVKQKEEFVERPTLHPELLQSGDGQSTKSGIFGSCGFFNSFYPYAYLSVVPLSFGVICPLSFIRSFTIRPACFVCTMKFILLSPL